MNIKAFVIPGFATGVTVVVLTGELTIRSAPTVRQILMKCLAQSPDAVVVDLADLWVDSKAVLTVFPAALRSSTSPATALLLCAASPTVSAMMSQRLLGDIGVYASREEAMSAAATAHSGAPQRMSLRLPPTPEAPGRARAMVVVACRRWNVDHISGPAAMVASELVSNAVEHAGTDAHFSVALRACYLHLSVHDGSPGMPVLQPRRYGETPLPERGRGLHIIEMYSTAWGIVPTALGKTVWVTLRTVPVGLRHSGPDPKLAPHNPA